MMKSIVFLVKALLIEVGVVVYKYVLSNREVTHKIFREIAPRSLKIVRIFEI